MLEDSEREGMACGGPAPVLSLRCRYASVKTAEYLLQREPEALERAEREAATAPQTAAGILRGAISESAGTSGHIPLNGESVLRAALAGGPGTINGRND